MTSRKQQKPDALVGRRVVVHDTATNDAGGPHPWRGEPCIVVSASTGGTYQVALIQPDGTAGTTQATLTMQQFTVLPEMDQQHEEGARLVNADPWLVATSLDNPRKRRGLDIDSLNALASSIKAQGLAQPILVRPLPGTRAADTFRDREPGKPLPTYELVCGERRLRACRLAGLATIPMLLKDLSDGAALELQLVENIEREDLDPMEEAEGFELLRTRLGYTVEQIAERIGKGKGASYVRKTMKLLDLTPESREAMYDGHLGRSTGLIVSRYPAAQQAEVVKFIRSLAGANGEPAPFRDVSPKVWARFNLELAQAPWDKGDATLVPEAGACATCPKRSTQTADLFDAVDDDEARCTDAECFGAKRAAHVERAAAEARKRGLQVISGEEAKEIFPSPWRGNYLEGYTRLDAAAYTETGADGVEREVTFGDALRKLGKKAPKPVVVINPHSGAAVEAIPDDLADKLMPPDDEAPTRNGPFNPFDPKKEDTRSPEEKAMDNHAVRRAVLYRTFDAIRTSGRTHADMLTIARAMFHLQEEPPQYLEAYLSWEGDLEDTDANDAFSVIEGKLAALPTDELAQITLMAAVEQLATRWPAATVDRVKLPQAYGVDILAVRDKVSEDLAAQEQREAGAQGDQGDEANQEAEEGAEA